MPTERRTDMTKLIVDFSTICESAPKKKKIKKNVYSETQGRTKYLAHWEADQRTGMWAYFRVRLRIKNRDCFALEEIQIKFLL